MPKVFVAGLFHETHTFLDRGTSMEDFTIREGESLLTCRANGSPMGGALEKFTDLGWEVVPGPYFQAMPSGIVEDEVLEAFWTAFLRGWDESVNTVFLVLHGAMVTESFLDVEGEILGRISELSRVPIFGVYDLHANFTETMARNSAGLVAYRENPHVDSYEAAIRSVEMLNRGESLQMIFRPAGVLWSPVATGTAEDPMRKLETRAREMEDACDFVKAVNVNAGFSFADTPDTGVSFSVVTNCVKRSRGLLDELVELARSLEPPANPELSVDDAMRFVKSNPVDGLTVLIEPSDNIGGGAPGDGTGLLRAMITYRLESAAVCICDPAAVRALAQLDFGEKITLPIGGKGSRFDEGPISIGIELVSRGSGRFELEDQNSHLASMSGDVFDMGQCAVCRVEGVTILLTSERTPPFDLGMWRSQGIEPNALKYIGVKAAVAHRQAFRTVSDIEIAIDTPGPCPSDLSKLSYRHARL